MNFNMFSPLAMLLDWIIINYPVHYYEEKSAQPFKRHTASDEFLSNKTAYLRMCASVQFINLSTRWNFHTETDRSNRGKLDVIGIQWT